MSFCYYGASGGGDLTLINPGEEAVLRWKATRTGAFVYHCIPGGGSMVPWHIASGMSGAVMVLPRTGLKDAAGKSLHYDRVYYIGEQDLYVPRDAKGKFKTYGSHIEAFADTVEVMHKLVPSHVVFNGSGCSDWQNAPATRLGETCSSCTPGRSRLASASGWRSWRLCVGDRKLLEPPTD
jgi:nitrite reductase (NO-forming)